MEIFFFLERLLFFKKTGFLLNFSSQLPDPSDQKYLIIFNFRHITDFVILKFPKLLGMLVFVIQENYFALQARKISTKFATMRNNSVARNYNEERIFAVCIANGAVG